MTNVSPETAEILSGFQLTHDEKLGRLRNAIAEKTAFVAESRAMRERQIAEIDAKINEAQTDLDRHANALRELESPAEESVLG